ncbi:MAG: hypothetical protein KC448_02990 [Yoonia sp.]|mgnify:CR=1 FL=1|nr:hypothetical protein [Yoonia sp.]
MTKAIEDFFAAWAVEDADKRADMIKGAVAEPVFYADPRTSDPVTSMDALLAYVGMFSQMAPGMAVAATNISTTLTFARATVQFGEGERSQTGQYMVDLDADGKITRCVGFIGMGEPS